MIDLHLHTTFSDGSDTLEQVLRICEEKKLNTIAITDHDMVKAYKSLKKKYVRNLFSGKIMVSGEFNCIVGGMPIEVLGYNIDAKKIGKLVNLKKMQQRDVIMYKMVANKMKEYGIKVKFTNKDYKRPRFFHEFYAELALHAETLQSHGIYIDCWGKLLREYIANPESNLFCDMSCVIPSIEVMVKAIRDAGGVASLAHPFNYVQNTKKILELIPTQVDGIECFHPSANKEEQAYLVEICKKHKLMITGGSDYHGHKGQVNSQKVSDKYIKQFDQSKFI